MRSVKSTLKISLLVAVIVFVVGYSGFEMRKVAGGPSLEIFTPTDGTSTENPLIEIKGEAQNVSSISLNDRPITVDKEGLFSEKLLLSPGYNIIKLAVSDRFGRSREKMLEIVLTKNESLGLMKSQKIN